MYTKPCQQLRAVLFVVVKEQLATFFSLVHYYYTIYIRFGSFDAMAGKRKKYKKHC